MKQNSKLVLLLVLTYMLTACSNDSSPSNGQTNGQTNGQSISEKVEQKSTELSEAVTSASESVSELAESAVTPVIEQAKTSVEEMAEAATSVVADANQEMTPESSATVGSEPKEHIIKGVITQWQPLVTFAQPGDTIRFTGMTGHDTASMEGMIPAGATAWHSKLGQEGFTVTVDKEGGYVYKCTPHITTGMVGIIVVGDKNPANLADLEANAGNVKVGGNMVKRAIRKLKKQLAL